MKIKYDFIEQSTFQVVQMTVKNKTKKHDIKTKEIYLCF